MNDWFEKNLVCPRDHQPLALRGNLVCAFGHEYPYVDGIPVMLMAEERPTHGACVDSIHQAACGSGLHDPDDATENRVGVDPYVQGAIAGTCGYMYAPLMGQLSRYPIPQIRLPAGCGQVLLDIGCNWGRWSISAARAGYKVVGIDPSLDAIRAAYKVAKQCEVSALFIVGDARHLPFRKGTFDLVFSYSVLQHFGREDVETTLDEIARVLKARGISLIQMLNAFGLRSLYNQAHRGFREASHFEVRYWSPTDLRKTFARHIGPSTLAVDGFFSANVQTTDLDILPARYRALVLSSDVLRQLSKKIPPMTSLADSLYIRSERIEE